MVKQQKILKNILRHLKLFRTFLRNCEESGKTVKKLQSDPEEPLNKLPIKEIDFSGQILCEFVKKMFKKL